MYQMLEEVIIVKEKAKFVISDENYKYRLGKREKIRTDFLIDLIEKYKYSESDIKLDIDVPELGSTDVLVLKQGTPYIVAQCKEKINSELNGREFKKETIEKAQALKAQYAVVVVNSLRAVFDITSRPKPKLVLDFPCKK